MDMFRFSEEISSSGLDETLRKYYNKPIEKNLKSIVAGPKLLAVPKQIIPNSNNSRRHHTI